MIDKNNSEGKKLELWKLMICDDEPEMCLNIRGMLDRFSEECGVEFEIFECYSGAELLRRLSFDTDVLLLDIKMEAMTGMEAAKIIRKTNQDLCIIFITTMTQYAMEGYLVHAFGFIKKPLRYSQFRLQMADTVRLLKSRKKETITLRSGSQTYNLEAGSILYLEIYGHEIHIVQTGETLSYYGTLSGLESSLNGKGFFRCHKSYLVNLRHVGKIESSQAVLNNGTVIPVSKYRKKEFMQAFASYMGGHL